MVLSSDAPTGPVWRPPSGPLQRWPRLFDTVAAALALAATALAWRSSLGETGVPIMGWVAALVASGALYWRRQCPVLTHWVVMGACVVALQAGTGSGVFALAFSLYSLGRHARSIRASLWGLGGAVLLVLRDLTSGGTPNAGQTVAALAVLALWYLGRRLRFRGEYLRLLEERAAHLEVQRSTLAEQAVAEERTRIARELHDIVAHQVSLMTVQAGAAKTVAKTEPGAAIEAMGAVEKAGRQALGELRHLLGVLRPDSVSSGLDPQPGVSNLPWLTEELAKTGLSVALSIEGETAELPARIQLAVYRIVQEALTNVLKHAGAEAAARVAVTVQPNTVEVLVRDDGTRRPDAAADGHGVMGMRERAQLLGGTFSAGPLPEGGFRVTARLPRQAPASSGTP